MSQSQPYKVVFIVAHDAYLKGARNICTLLEQQKRVDVRCFTTSRWLVAQGLSWLEMDRAGRMEALQQADLIFAGLGGRDLNRLIHSLRGPEAAEAAVGHSPLIVGYFPGVLHLHIFESLASRLRCDRVLLSCERDYRLYRHLALATIGENNGLLLGAPWIGQPPHQDQRCDIDLLFVEQSVVPESHAERTRLVEHLARLARQHPDWRIVVALRARKGEASSHQLEYCLEDVSQQLDSSSPRLEFVLGDIDQLLTRARRVATISSSVAFTSLAWRKPTLFISDLGVRECWGNDLFQHSGYMTSLYQACHHGVSINRWYQQFIQLPQPSVIAGLCGTVPSAVGKAIPGIRASNLRLLWLVLMFCLKNRKKPLPDICRLMCTIGNINSRIYNGVE